MSKEKDDKKALFEIVYENGTTKEQYRRFWRQYPIKYIFTSVFHSVIFIVILLFYLLFSDYSILTFFLLSLAIIIFFLILNYVRLDKLSDAEYEKIPSLKRSKRYVFYNDYFFIDFGVSTCVVEYSRIKKCVETNDDFFIELVDEEKVFGLPKSLINKDQERHIREMSKNVYLNRTKEFKKNNSEYRRNFTEKILLIVFTILTLLSITVAIVAEYIISDKYMFREMGPSLFWLFILLMPIPLICLILGFRLHGKHKTIFTIVVGAFVFLLFITSATNEFLYQENQRNVKNIESYMKFIDIEVDDVLFPLQQEKLSLNIDGVEVSGLKTTFSTMNVVSGKETVEEQFFNKSHLINLKDADDSIRDFIYIGSQSDREQFGFIYVVETDKYNELPKESGNYHIYSISFNALDFVIYEFDYEVTN